MLTTSGTRRERMKIQASIFSFLKEALIKAEFLLKLYYFLGRKKVEVEEGNQHFQTPSVYYLASKC